MSYAAVNWALSQKLRPAHRFVLVVLCNCEREGSHVAFPSLASIGESTGLNRKTVIEAVAELQRRGLIIDSGERVGRTRQIVVWRLPFNGAESGPVEQAHNRNGSKNGTVPISEGKGPVFSSKSPTFSAKGPENGTRNSKQEQEERTVREKESDVGVDGLFDALPNWIDPDAWKGFEQMRRAKKKPLTDRARHNTLRELDRLRNQGHDANAVLDQSTTNSWAGVFPLKAQTARKATNGVHFETQEYTETWS